MPRYKRPNSYTGPQSSQSLTGSVRAANSVEAAAADSDSLYISPVTLASAVGSLVPTATTTVFGTVKLTDLGAPTGTVATKFYADNLAIAGAPAWSETVSGIGQLATSLETTTYTDDNVAITPLKLSLAFASPPAMGGTLAASGLFTTIGATGLASLSASATITTGATALNLASDASTGAVNIGTGAGARTLIIGNVTGATAVTINTGTGGIALNTTGAGDMVFASADTVLIDSAGVLELNSSAGVIGIGNDAVAQNINMGTGAAARTITLGNSTGATSIVLNAGTGALNIGTNLIAHTVTIGNATGATALVLTTGTGNFVLDGVAGSTYAVGASTTTGTVLIGGNAQTGTITLGSSSGTNIVAIGAGEGATTINIARGATAAKVVNIADGAVANLVTIGTTSGAAAMTLRAGTGNFSLDGAATTAYTMMPSTTSGTINIGGTGENTGTVTLFGGSGLQTINFANSTGGKTLAIATGAGANIVSLGSSNGASSLTLLAGTGNYSLDGAATSTYTIAASTTSGTFTLGGTAQTGTMTLGSSSGINIVALGAGEGATTVNIAGGATAAKVVNIATGAVANLVTIGTASGAAAMNLLVGTGNFSLDGAATSAYTFMPTTTSGTINIGGTGGNTGTVTLFGGTGIQAINLANSTGVKTLQIATGAAANVVTIGSTNTTASTTIQAGSGNVNIVGNLVLSNVATQIRMNGGAVTDFIGRGTLVAGTVTIANTNIADEDRILVTRSNLNGTPALGFLVTTISDATSFTVAAFTTTGAAAITDVSSFDYVILRQF